MVLQVKPKKCANSQRNALYALQDVGNFQFLVFTKDDPGCLFPVAQRDVGFRCKSGDPAIFLFLDFRVDQEGGPFPPKGGENRFSSPLLELPVGGIGVER